MAIRRFNKCTIWIKGEEDSFSGFPSEAVPRVYMCEVKRGGTTKNVDKSGVEFFPASTFWVRESDLISGIHSEPKEGEMIAKGDHFDSVDFSAFDAEAIKGVKVHDHAKFNESDSYTIGTK